MERLTTHICGHAHGAEGLRDDNLTGNYCRGEFEATAIVDRLSAIEDILGDEYDLDRLRALTKADREERIFISPVKIGDTVYYITGLYGNLVKPATVEEVYFGDSTLALGVSTGFAKFPILEKHYFITKEAAEDALRRRCKED